MRAFRIDHDRTLLVAQETRDRVPFVILVNRREQFVGRPVAWRGHWAGGLLLWNRGAYSCVWLRDRVKLGAGPDYRFLARSVDIDWPAPEAAVHHIHLAFAD